MLFLLWLFGEDAFPNTIVGWLAGAVLAVGVLWVFFWLMLWLR